MYLVKSYAKINLSLEVGEKIEKYHLIKSVVQLIGLHDVLNIEFKNGNEIEIISDTINVPTDENNTIYKAFYLFIKETSLNFGLRINLKKNIPTKSGLGGGSSNAAAVLKTLNKKFKNILTKEQLLKISFKIGSDVPFFLSKGTALIENFGDKVTNLQPIEKLYVLLMKPHLDITTEDAYNEIDKLRSFKKLKENNSTANLIKFLNNKNNKNKNKQELKNIFNELSKEIANDFEHIYVGNPSILHYKKLLYSCGANFACLSGSGSSVYGIFLLESVRNLAFQSIKNGNINDHFDIWKCETLNEIGIL